MINNNEAYSRELEYEQMLEEEHIMHNRQARDNLDHLDRIFEWIPTEVINFYTGIDEDRILEFQRGAMLDTTELAEMTMYIEEIDSAMQLHKEGVETINRLVKDPYKG